MTLHDDFRAAVLALNPEAYWEFQGLAPGALADSSGNGHALAGHGAWGVNYNVIGWDGFQYASFNGTDAYFTIGGTNPLPSGPFSVFAVMQPTTGPTIAFDNENSASLTQGAGLFVANSGSNFGYGCRMGNGGGNVVVVDNQPFGIYGSGWQWVGMIYDGISVTLYINGTPIKGALMSGFALGTLQPTIGSYPSVGTFFRGGISDMYILRSVQSLSSVRQIAALTGNPSSPSAQELNAQLAAILDAVTIRAY